MPADTPAVLTFLTVGHWYLPDSPASPFSLHLTTSVATCEDSEWPWTAGEARGKQVVKPSSGHRRSRNLLSPLMVI